MNLRCVPFLMTEGQRLNVSDGRINYDRLQGKNTESYEISLETVLQIRHENETESVAITFSHEMERARKVLLSFEGESEAVRFTNEIWRRLEGVGFQRFDRRVNIFQTLKLPLLCSALFLCTGTFLSWFAYCIEMQPQFRFHLLETNAVFIIACFEEIGYVPILILTFTAAIICFIYMAHKVCNITTERVIAKARGKNLLRKI